MLKNWIPQIKQKNQIIVKKNPNNSFEVLGFFDNSDIRGCNLMVL
jgi:hypothetical protein